MTRQLYRTTVEIDGDDYERLAEAYQNSDAKSVRAFIENELIPAALDEAGAER